MGCVSGIWSDLFKFFKYSIMVSNFRKSIIVGTSTDIGKTFVVEKIIDECKSKGEKIDVIKPLITGFDINDKNCDTIRILNKMGLEKSEENLAKISPFRLKTPISPLSAAKKEGVRINYDEVLAFCQNRISEERKMGNVLVETAGGLMSPICEDKTFLDLVRDLNIEVILVGACFLGGISAILTNYEVLKSKNIQNITILINNHLDFDEKYLKMDDFTTEVRNFVDCEVFLVDNFVYLN